MSQDIRLAKGEVVDEIKENIGDLSELQTDEKSSVVAAINELKEYGGGTQLKMQDRMITENGTYTPDYPYGGFGIVTVSVEDEWLKRASKCNGMFSYRQDIDFEEIDVHDVWSAQSMFECCRGIKNMNVKGTCIDYMPGIFYNCTSLENVVFECSTFENSDITDRADDGYSSVNMQNKSKQMFAYAATNKELKIHFNGKPHLSYICHSCNAKSITLTTDYYSDKVVDADYSFRETMANRISLPDIKISNFCYGCYGNQKLTELSGGEWSECTDMSYAFYGCNMLEKLPDIDTSGCTSLYYTFKDCTNLREIFEIDASSCKDLNSAFYNCTSLESVRIVNVKKFSSSNSLTSTFYNCSSLKSIYISSMSGVSATSTGNISNTFYGCGELKDLIIDAEEATEVSLNLSHCTKLTVDSILSVINSLKTRTEIPASASAKSGVLTLGSENIAKLDSEQAALVTNKNWLLV